MTPDEQEDAALDEGWAEAEEHRDVFQRLACLTETDLLLALARDREVLRVLIKACAMVGLECERRIRERDKVDRGLG